MSGVLTTRGLTTRGPIFRPGPNNYCSKGGQHYPPYKSLSSGQCNNMVSLILIHWIEIYPTDSAIQLGPGLLIRNYVIINILRIKHQHKDFLKSILNLHITLSFLFILNRNEKYVHTLLQFPGKPYSISVQNDKSLCSFSD